MEKLYGCPVNGFQCFYDDFIKLLKKFEKNGGCLFNLCKKRENVSLSLLELSFICNLQFRLFEVELN